MSSKGIEQVAVLGTIDPDANTAGALTSDWADASKFHQMIGVLLAGDLGASATVDFKLQQATDSSGTGAKDITGKAATQLTQASPDDSNKQVLINVRADELDVANGFRYVAMVLTTAVATSDGGAVLLGVEPHKGPASQNDLASVAEIV